MCYYGVGDNHVQEDAQIGANFPVLGMIPAGAVISLVGTGLRVGIRHMASKRKNSTLI